MSLFSPLKLPNGITIPNRIAKAAMEENMADDDHAPSADLLHLYKAWAAGEAGLIITGNVMVDARAMTGPAAWCWKTIATSTASRPGPRQAAPGCAVLDADQPSWPPDARVARPADAGPSAVALDLGTSPAFSDAARDDGSRHRRCRAPLRPPRCWPSAPASPAWSPCRPWLSAQPVPVAAGQPAHRPLGRQPGEPCPPAARHRAHSRRRGAGFAVAVKLNSADFQRGGFSPEDAQAVVAMLAPLGVDLVELSGGSYEAPAMMGSARDERTGARPISSNSRRKSPRWRPCR
jgi:hypothetical protein